MEERRRTNRRTLESKLLIKRLDGSGQEDAQIEITDVSKTGIGFSCNKLLDIGAVYESFLRIWTTAMALSLSACRSLRLPGSRPMIP